MAKKKKNEQGRVIGIPGDVIIDSDYQAMAPPHIWYADDPKLKEIHRRGITGKGIKVSINDTGGTDNHPGMKPPKQMFSHVGGSPKDRNGHGTACSFIVLQMAPDIEYVTVKVLGDSGSGATTGINRGYLTAAQHDVDIINCSYGDNGGPPIQEDIDAINAAYTAGVRLVNVAAGNAGFNGHTNTLGRPASYFNTGATGATDRNHRISGFSSGGKELDWATFGQDMPFARPGGGYGRGSGTSFSCPRMVGIFCLLYQAMREVGLPDLRGVKAHREYMLENGLLIDRGDYGEDPSYGLGTPSEEKIFDHILSITPSWL